MTASSTTLRSLRRSLLAALFLLHGCGDGDAGPPDASDGDDGGLVVDGGLVEDGGLVDDGGSGEVDGGSGEIDAGPIALDAGPIALDAGPIALDAGAPDAGPPLVPRDVLQVRLEAASTLTPSLLVPVGTDLLLVGTISVSGARDLFVVRLDGNYEVRWSQRYAVAGYATATRAIVDGDALVIVGAVQDSFGGTLDGLITSVSIGDGTVRWARSLGEGRETLSDVVRLDGGALGVVGTSRSYNLEVGVIERPFVAVLEASGERRWARSVYRAFSGGRGIAIARGPGSDLTIAVRSDAEGGDVELLTVASSGPLRRGWAITGVVGDPVALDTSTGTTMSLVASYTTPSGISYARSTTYTELDAAAGTVGRAWGAYGTTLGAAFTASRVAFAQQSNPRSADLRLFDRSGSLVGGRILQPGGATSSADSFLAAVIDGTGVRGVARIDDDLWLVRSPLLASSDGCVMSTTTAGSLASTPSLTVITAYAVAASLPSVTTTLTASALPLTRLDECPP